MPPTIRVRLTEGEFLERAVRRLREQEPHEDDLVGQPRDVHDEPLPRDVLEADWVDEGGEEAREAAEELEDGDAARALHVRPYFDHVGWVLVSLVFTQSRRNSLA